MATVRSDVAQSVVVPRGATVLVVDDNDVACTVIRRMLERTGYSVVVCSNADAALELCRRNDVTLDLLLTDLVLREMSGEELAGR